MRFFVAALGMLSVAVVLGGAGAACSSDPAATSFDLPEVGALDTSRPDSGDTSDSGETPDGEGPPDASDKTPPGRVTDLAGTPAGSTAISLTWTAPSDESGHATAYDIRVSPTAMTTEAELLAGTAVAGAPTPGAAGSPQKLDVTKLLPETAYHFALRARDAAGNWSAVSNDTIVTTKPRASFLVTEVAVSNAAATGFDFIELTATKAGSAEGIEIRQLSTVLHAIAPLDVALGDRVVVHMTALPGPAGFAQEDTTKNKAGSTDAFASADAYDVYSATNGLTGTDNIVSVVDGTTTLDAVAISNRDNAVATATMTAFAKAKTDAAWSFTLAPVDAVNDCETEGDAVNVATATAETPCGGFKSIVAAGISLNRNGLTDTNTKADFYLAAQTPGAANTPAPAPTLASASALVDATTVDLTFDQEIAPASVAAASFTIPGLTVSAATASFNHVTLTTDAQGEGGYDVTLASTVTNFQAVPPAILTARFCGFAAVPPQLTINEVSPNLGTADLIELAVVHGGSLNGFTLRLNPTTTAGSSGTLLATLPAICAATGDLVVVHLAPPALPPSETLAKDELTNALYAQNYDGAWDVRGSNTGLTTTNQIITVRNPAGTYVEGVAFSNGSTPTQSQVDSLVFLQAQGLWMPADCGGAMCSIATAPGVSADWSGVGSTPAGNSARRSAPTNDASAWSVGASSFGGTN